MDEPAQGRSVADEHGVTMGVRQAESVQAARPPDPTHHACKRSPGCDRWRQDAVVDRTKNNLKSDHSRTVVTLARGSSSQ